jgi:phage terminase small subunit
MQVAPISLPRPPDAIAEEMTTGALDVWMMVEPALSAANLLTSANLFQLVRYCRLTDELRTLQNKIDTLTHDNMNGFAMRMVQDLTKVRRSTATELMELDRVFGITPLFGDAIRRPEVVPDDPISRMLDD